MEEAVQKKNKKKDKNKNKKETSKWEEFPDVDVGARVQKGLETTKSKDPPRKRQQGIQETYNQSTRTRRKKEEIYMHVSPPYIFDLLCFFAFANRLLA